MTLSLIPYSAQSRERERLNKGQKASFGGVLLSDAALATIITEYEKKIGLLQIELEKATKEMTSELKTAEAVCKAKLDGEKAKQDSCKMDLLRQEKIFDKASKKLTRKSPWYKSPYMHFILGGLVTGGVCVGASRLN